MKTMLVTLDHLSDTLPVYLRPDCYDSSSFSKTDPHKVPLQDIIIARGE